MAVYEANKAPRPWLRLSRTTLQLSDKALATRNVALTFLSSVGAAGFSLITVPLYLHLLGAARYGVVAFVWMIVGYFGLFVLGLDRAMTNLLAQNRHVPAAACSLFTTAFMLNLGTSSAGAIILYFVGSQVLGQVLHTGGALNAELMAALPWIAAAVPVATTTSIVIGALEAYERFPTLAWSQFGATLLFQTVPIAVAGLIGPQLTWVVPAAIVTRAFATLVMLALLWPVMRLPIRPVFERRWVGPLIRYGSAVGVSGVVSPLLLNLDRILISGGLGATAVAYYTVPSNLVTAVQILPASLLRVLFPKLSILSEAEATASSVSATLGLAALLTPLIVGGILFAELFMKLWVGHSFAGHMQGLAEIFLCGAWFNSLAWSPFTLLQAQGRPGIAARLHVIEIIPFVAVVWFGIKLGGLQGAAFAYSIRMAIDALLLLQASGLGPSLYKHLLLPAGLILGALAVSLYLPSTNPSYLIASAALLGTALLWAAKCSRRWKTMPWSSGILRLRSGVKAGHL